MGMRICRPAAADAARFLQRMCLWKYFCKHTLEPLVKNTWVIWGGRGGWPYWLIFQMWELILKLFDYFVRPSHSFILSQTLGPSHLKKAPHRQVFWLLSLKMRNNSKFFSGQPLSSNMIAKEVGQYLYFPLNYFSLGWKLKNSINHLEIYSS